MTLTVRHLVPFGAEIGGVDLAAPLDPATVAEIRATWIANLVVVFHGQTLTEAALSAFGRRIGEPDMNPGGGLTGDPNYRDVGIISNVIVDGKRIGALGDGDLSWHSDMSYIDDPPTASILYAEEVPESGGDTCFLNMYAALEALPADLRAEIEGLSLNHDSSTNSAGGLRRGVAPVTDVSEAPGAHHPIVRVHEESGGRALYLGRRLNAYVIGKSVAESETLLDRIWAALDAPGLVYRHRWRQGDVLMWDNRCTMHRRDAFAPAMRRIMHRTQVKGPAPV